ncbi:TonB-dependent siderophore receptor [cf. Phormidesmis sp. LEGE 11477]|uniref:TonB-dependent siderophore receptor n=1 Tax=cf. Phormidesmis sp. LEGE 11477 TaxID=1828680 RepID=UPI001880AD0C|nr:TonB-dependent siderophore receptor [cf. Phormidesmis sp. LEGE 11477]MBE9062516.1 TonB-dependent siderophore receptor [cf. Phormidesmis sp. LEGE 11477]
MARLFGLLGWGMLGWMGLFSVVMTSAAIAQEDSLSSDLAQSNRPPSNLVPNPRQIVGIQLTTTDDELTLQLTANSPLSASETSSIDNALIIEIPNVRLATEEEFFEQFNPTADIALVQVTQISDNRVRITVTGSDALPEAAVRTRTAGLTLGITPGIAGNASESDSEALRIVVLEDIDEGYNPTDSSTAIGIDTPLRDTPFSVQVIPQAVIEDRNVVELGEALETAGSVVSAGGRGVSRDGPNFLIRGFPVVDSIFRDGIATSSLASIGTEDIERVEVLRGPASILFGQGEPGGIINLVSKRPLDEPFYSVSASVGNFDTYRGAIDVSGPLNEQKTVKYRLNLSYENLGSFRDFVDSESLLISPIVTWDISDRTSLEFYGRYAYDQETIDNGIPASGDGVVDIPRSRFLGENFAEFTQNQFSLGYRLDHEFSEDWSLRHATQYFSFDPERFGPLSVAFNEETGDLARFEYFADDQERQFFTNVEAIGRFSTGSVEHQLLVGTEYRRDSESPSFQFGPPYTSINVFDPVYTEEPYDINPDFFRDGITNNIAFYLQDQLEIIPQLKLIGGLRYDLVSRRISEEDLDEPRQDDFDFSDEALTPRFGVIYQPIDPLSLYASYTASFNPSTGVSRNDDDSIFEPETGRQFEVGVKADLLDSLSLNFAAFDIRKKNVQVPDPDDFPFSRQTGELASRGIELNLDGEILPGWNMTAAYTYLNAFVSDDTRADLVGNDFANAPENQFSLWTTYEVQQGNLEGLGAGLGLFYVGDRQGDLNNTFTMPSYLRTDGALFYKRNNWRSQLNFENLFNINYIDSSTFGFRSRVNPGAPFGITATFSIEF